MNRFFVDHTAMAFAQIIQLSERSSAEPSDEQAPTATQSLALKALESAKATVRFLELVETGDCIDRLERSIHNGDILNKELYF
jgi:hypothetical protein